jgi:hypothetical protein
MRCRTPTAEASKKWLARAALVLLGGLILTAPVRAANLNMVSVGISNYKDDLPKLASAHKDAMGASKTFKGQQGKLFTQVSVKQLLNEQATAGNVLNALEGLRAKATADTYTLLFVASHGGVTNGEYAFCAFDQDVAWSSIKSALGKLPGKVIVVLDTCGAGGVTAGGNMIVFSACLSRQTSGENDAHGFFTRAFLAGLSGKADANKDGKVTLAELDAYISNQLEIMNKGRQSNDFQQCTLNGNYTGTWTQEGSKVTITMTDVELSYTGTLSGATIAGQGKDTNNGTWNFTVNWSN